VLPASRFDGLRGVVLLSADTRYARKYGFACLRSLAAHVGADLLVHVHVYDPDSEIVGEIVTVARQASLAPVAVTTERSPFAADAAQQRKSWYACGRLLRLPELLERYRAPVLSLDIDLVAERPLAALFDAPPAADLRLNPRHSIDAPWLDIVANIIVAFPTAAARAYLDAVGQYVVRYLARERDPWLLDQTALFCVNRMMQRYAVAPRIDWIRDDEKLALWHLGHGYDHLLADPRFTRYAGPPSS
jgi:hypothetical protein